MRNFFQLFRNRRPRASRRRRRALRFFRRQKRRFLSYHHSTAQSPRIPENPHAAAARFSCSLDHGSDDDEYLSPTTSPTDEIPSTSYTMHPNSHITVPSPNSRTQRELHQSSSETPHRIETLSETTSKSRRRTNYMPGLESFRPYPRPAPRLPFMSASANDDEEEDPEVSPLSEAASSVGTRSCPSPESPLWMAHKWPLHPRTEMESIPIRPIAHEDPRLTVPPADIDRSDSAEVERFEPLNQGRSINAERMFASFPSEAEASLEHSVISPIKFTPPQIAASMPPRFSNSTIIEEYKLPNQGRSDNAEAIFAPIHSDAESSHEYPLISPIEPNSSQTAVPMPPGFSNSAIVQGWRPLTPISAQTSTPRRSKTAIAEQLTPLRSRRNSRIGITAPPPSPSTDVRPRFETSLSNIAESPSLKTSDKSIVGVSQSSIAPESIELDLGNPSSVYSRSDSSWPPNSATSSSTDSTTPLLSSCPHRASDWSFSESLDTTPPLVPYHDASSSDESSADDDPRERSARSSISSLPLPAPCHYAEPSDRSSLDALSTEETPASSQTSFPSKSLQSRPSPSSQSSVSSTESYAYSPLPAEDPSSLDQWASPTTESSPPTSPLLYSTSSSFPPLRGGGIATPLPWHHFQHRPYESDFPEASSPRRVCLFGLPDTDTFAERYHL